MSDSASTLFVGSAVTVGVGATAAGIFNIFNNFNQQCLADTDADKTARGARDFSLALSGVQAGIGGMFVLGLGYAFIQNKGIKLLQTGTGRSTMMVAVLLGISLITILTTNARVDEVSDTCKPTETWSTITWVFTILAWVGAAAILGPKAFEIVKSFKK